MVRTLNQLMEAVRSQTNELDTDFIGPDDIVRWLNDAQKDLVDILKLETHINIPLIESQDMYDIPEDLNRFVRVYVDDTLYRIKDLRTFKEVPQDYTYAIWGKQIILTPMPDEDDVGKHLSIYYYKKPKELIELEDVSDVDDNYHELLTLYAIAQCYHKGQEFQQFAVCMEEYEKRKLAAYFGQDKHERNEPIEQKFHW